MKATILDSDALRAISPAALAAYVRAEGWKKSEAYGAYADIYQSTGKAEIVVPRTDRLGDYSTVVSKLITIFAEANGRDELSTYRDLIEADRDVVRVRSFGVDDDGSVPIDAGVEIVSQSRQLLLAAACAVRAPQSLYRAGANKEATDYMRRVKLGQTEHGSFVVTLLVPVPPQLQPQLDPSWGDLENEPFARQVTRRLVSALQASRRAVELSASGEGDDAFKKAVDEGVSANLCEAVAGLIENSTNLDIMVSWARTRPTPQAAHRISFSTNDAEILKEAARTFRARHPRPDVSLFGTVPALKREQDEDEGLITLKTLIDDKPQSVRAVLDQANYSIAVRAHDAKAPIIVKGDLERIGERWQLTNATVTLLGDDPGTIDEQAT